MYFDRRALKERARTAVRETRPRAWTVTLLFVLLAVALPWLVKIFFNPLWELLPQMFEDMADMIHANQEPDERWALDLMGRLVGGGAAVMFLSVFFSLLSMVLGYGYRSYALEVYRRREAGPGRIFSAFSLAGRVIGASLMIGIFILLWTMLIDLVGGVVLGLCNQLLADLSLLASILSSLISLAMTLGSLLVACRYCLVPYYLMTNPDMGVFEAITAGKLSMRGNCVKKLKLELSFLGWALAIAAIFGAVFMCGYVVVLFTAGGDWLREIGELSRSAMPDWRQAELAMRAMADLFRAIRLPMVIVYILSWLVTLPLGLWLRAYRTTAEAGFFLTVTGQTAQRPEEAPCPSVPQPPLPPMSQQPPIPPAPPEPEPPAEGPAEPDPGQDPDMGPGEE